MRALRALAALLACVSAPALAQDIAVTNATVAIGDGGDAPDWAITAGFQTRF